MISTSIQRIPEEIKITAACAYDLREVSEILKPYLIWDGASEDFRFSTKRGDYKPIFDFNKNELVAYLFENPETCEKILTDSYDKRYTPSSFIAEVPGGYSVGWFDHSRSQVRTFTNLHEAAADYVLLSWDLGRL